MSGFGSCAVRPGFFINRIFCHVFRWIIKNRGSFVININQEA